MEGICFAGLDEMQDFLREPFIEILMSGEKNSIVSAAIDMDPLLELKENEASQMCRPEGAGFDKHKMDFKTDDHRYVGGYLEFYFEGETLRAVEGGLILLWL